jgi:hypothetical protein
VSGVLAGLDLRQHDADRDQRQGDHEHGIADEARDDTRAIVGALLQCAA